MKDETADPVKLKPVVFYGGRVGKRNKQNAFQQMLLMKSLAVTQDPEELRKMVGFTRVAEVYRTLDKMMIRREYHDAMIRAGVDPDFLVRNLKEIAISGRKDSDRLNALKALLKSVGLEQYKESAIGGGSGWEEAVLKKDEEIHALGEGEEMEAYEVVQPVLPESVRRSHEAEAETLRGIYE